MQNVNLLGIELQERSAKESLFLTYRFLNEGAVHIILYMTMSALLEANKKEEEKTWIEAADLTPWGDTEILGAAGVTARSRYHEVREKEFMKSFFRGIAKTHKSVLTLSDTKERAELLKQELMELQDGITVAGTMAISDTMENKESIINEINMIAPTVIVARMPFSVQQKWLTECKPYINTLIWIGIPEHLSFVQGKEMPVTKVGKQLLNILFNRQVNKYKK